MEVVASGSILTGALQAFVDVALAVVALETFVRSRRGRRGRRRKNRKKRKKRKKRTRRMMRRRMGRSRIPYRVVIAIEWVIVIVLPESMSQT